MNEFARIRNLSRIIGSPSRRVIVGIGDDAAVLQRTTNQLLFCSDAMVEGTHFDLSYSTAADIGHKSLAACLSDIAAMNGEPLYALFSIALPKSIPEKFLDEFYEAATLLARAHKIDIVGGDLTSSPSGIFIDVSAIGQASHPITRAGAKPGDLVVVSGFPGMSCAGLQALRDGLRENYPELVKAHLTPNPRFDLLDFLGSRATSMMDISDGLSSELYHLAEASGVGFEIQADLVPLHPLAINLAKKSKQNPYEWAMSGGEDYELVATLDPAKVTGPVPSGLTVIGKVTGESGQVFELRDGERTTLVRSGYDHFASS